MQFDYDRLADGAMRAAEAAYESTLTSHHAECRCAECKLIESVERELRFRAGTATPEDYAE